MAVSALGTTKVDGQLALRQHLMPVVPTDGHDSGCSKHVGARWESGGPNRNPTTVAWTSIYVYRFDASHTIWAVSHQAKSGAQAAADCCKVAKSRRGLAYSDAALTEFSMHLQHLYSKGLLMKQPLVPGTMEAQVGDTTLVNLHMAKMSSNVHLWLTMGAYKKFGAWCISAPSTTFAVFANHRSGSTSYRLPSRPHRRTFGCSGMIDRCSLNLELDP